MSEKDMTTLASGDSYEAKEDPLSEADNKRVGHGNKHCKDEPGVAKVKPEYLNVGHVPRLVTDFLPEDAAQELRDITSQYKQATPQIEGATENTAATEGTTGTAPPNKKVKLRGRNKKRPVTKRADASTRLCPTIVQQTECRFGEKCIYNHDVEAFLADKPQDLGENCYIFQTFGKCPYGITCRFGSQHLDKDGNNIVNENLLKESLKISQTYNAIGKELQATLRKKKYDFSRSNKIINRIQQLNKKEQKRDYNESSKVIEDAKCISSEAAQVCSVSDLDINEARKQATTESVKSLSSCDTHHAEKTQQKIPADIGTNSTKPDEPPGNHMNSQHHGCVTDEDLIRLRVTEKKKIHFADKLYLAPLTTVGNLPFRRICKKLGADITCGEMAMATNLLQGQQSEWALLRRHHTEDLFGVQICGGFVDSLTRCAQMLTDSINIDFIDLNCGCPIDLVFKKGEGSALMGRANRFEQIVQSMTTVMDIPLTVKIRTGIFEDKSIAHGLIPRLRNAGASLVTLHGRSREQRYTKLADWDYIKTCADAAQPMPLFGNGDILSYEDYNLRREQTGVAGCMIARGALIKPWIFTEIKEQRHWDISAGERLDILREFVAGGLEHWGSDQQGVDTTRRFLLEWLSFLYRYIPVGLLERVPQKINERPPYYFGRNDLETLMASGNSGDWVRISEMLLGPVPDGFTFLPKHRANSYK